MIATRPMVLEAREAPAGCCVFDVATPERSEEIAARCQTPRIGAWRSAGLMHGGGRGD
jgi:hypothetical protein